MARKLSLSEARQRAGRFCALRERSPQEVFEKVKTWGLSEAESQEVVSALTDSGFIDSTRFAYAYCNDKFEFNSWGKQKIKASIYRHQISPQLVEEALERIDPRKYQARLFSLAQKKWSSLGPEEQHQKKQKTARYLASKGFEQDLIWKVIHSLSEKGH